MTCQKQLDLSSVAGCCIFKFPPYFFSKTDLPSLVRLRLSYNSRTMIPRNISRESKLILMPAVASFGATRVQFRLFVIRDWFQSLRQALHPFCTMLGCLDEYSSKANRSENVLDIQARYRKSTWFPPFRPPLLQTRPSKLPSTKVKLDYPSVL